MLARALDAQLELFHVITDPVAVDTLEVARQGIESYEAEQRQRYLKRLERMAAPLRRTGLEVGVAAEWDHPVHEAVVRRAQATGAGLIVSERHAGRHVAPWLLHYSDRELMRHSPVPVLLSKTRRRYDDVKVLAAIDPSHALAKSARMDEQILRMAAQLNDAMRGQLHVLHAFVPSLIDIPESELLLPDSPARILRGAEAVARTRLDKALRAARLGALPRSRRHLVARHPVDAIPLLAKKLDVDIVVMGLLRTGFKGFFIGNTAERLLDDLACDLLVVKPPGFRTHVPARSRGPELVALGVPHGVV